MKPLEAVDKTCRCRAAVSAAKADTDTGETSCNSTSVAADESVGALLSRRLRLSPGTVPGSTSARCFAWSRCALVYLGVLIILAMSIAAGDMINALWQLFQAAAHCWPCWSCALSRCCRASDWLKGARHSVYYFRTVLRSTCPVSLDLHRHPSISSQSKLPPTRGLHSFILPKAVITRRPRCRYGAPKRQ